MLVAFSSNCGKTNCTSNQKPYGYSSQHIGEQHDSGTLDRNANSPLQSWIEQHDASTMVRDTASLSES